MKTLYYLGGPWDMMKRAIPSDPQPVVIIREPIETAPCPDDAAAIRFRDHRYGVRQVGRDTFVAVHEGLLP